MNSSTPGTFEPTGESEDLLPDLEDAATESKRCEIVYFSMSRGAETRRKVDPYTLLFWEHAWYLVAYCHERKDVMLFRVDRSCAGSWALPGGRWWWSRRRFREKASTQGTNTKQQKVWGAQWTRRSRASGPALRKSG